MKDRYQKLIDWFDSYTAKFDLENKKEQKNIQLKIDHSRRVTEDMGEITSRMQLSSDEKYLAKIIALLHDIGRFKQYEQYKTFSDYRSEDHGQLGVAVIKENKLIEDLSRNQQSIIFKAIENHNKADLKEKHCNNEQELFYAKLIRDADKLDIFNIFVERYKRKSQKDYIIKLSNEPEISDEIYNKVLRKESINYDRLETINDLKIMQLGWIYDINFKETLVIIKKREYIETIYNSMEQSQRGEKIYQQVKEYV